VATCPHVDVAANNLPHLVPCSAAVQSRVDVVAVVLRCEGREHQRPVGVHQAEVWDLHHGGAVPQVPPQLGRGAPVCRAIHAAARTVGKLDPMGGLLNEEGPLQVQRYTPHCNTTQIFLVVSYQTPCLSLPLYGGGIR
jgi:hypothetical protein